MIEKFFDTFLATLKDIAPIVFLIGSFQIFVIKKSIPNLKSVLIGAMFVIFGLTFFLIGLEQALFPLGETMAKQLSDVEFIKQSYGGNLSDWQAYYWIYLFAFFIGFATTMAEPSLKAVAIKANEVSGGVLNESTLKLVVAIGAGVALVLGTHRIVIGLPLINYLLTCYIVVIIQTIFVKKDFVSLAYDSGGVTTSTITVPIVTSLGLGLASVIPGRSPAVDGFGLIALVCTFPIISVLFYIQIKDIFRFFNKKYFS